MQTQIIVTKHMTGPSIGGEEMEQDWVDCPTFLDAGMVMEDMVIFFKAQGLELFDEGKTHRHLGVIQGDDELIIELQLNPHPVALN